MITYQGILTKLGTCIDIKEIWFGIANGQISSIFDSVVCPDTIMAGYYLFPFLLVKVFRGKVQFK